MLQEKKRKEKKTHFFHSNRESGTDKKMFQNVFAFIARSGI